MARVQQDFQSGPSRIPCRLHFTNNSERCITIIWIDFKGQEISFGFLQPGAMKPVQTYVGHPWICRDAASKRLLLLNRSTFYYATKENLNGKRINNLPVVEISAGIQMFSLLDLCADAVSRLVMSVKEVETMRIPDTLKDLLSLCIKNSTIVIPEMSRF